MVSTLRAEWIKLTSTRAPIWALAAVLVLGLGVAFLLGVVAVGGAPMPPARAATGVAQFGVPVLMVLASMTVTGEYRTQLIRTTFLATPNRTVVLVAKAVLAAAVAGVSAAVSVFGAILVARAVSRPSVTAELTLAGQPSWRAIGAIALYAAVAAVLAVAVGTLVRASAGAVAVLLLWPLVVELLVGILPSTGPRFGPYLPFANAANFTGVQWLYPGYYMAWDPAGSMVYFIAVVAVIFGCALVVVNRRDA